jgi:hypothetical protein
MPARSEALKARAPEGKRSKQSVNYSEGNAAEHCGICRHFQLPNACALVEGHIVPAFWCRLFARTKLLPQTIKHMASKMGA